MARDPGNGKVLFNNQQMFICSYSVSENGSYELSIRVEKEAKERQNEQRQSSSSKNQRVAWWSRNVHLWGWDLGSIKKYAKEFGIYSIGNREKMEESDEMDESM